ncbi:sensor histidine kinase, partial [Priestia megaterium]|nr:sensor histidine kinase [Priestia megaterium]
SVGMYYQTRKVLLVSIFCILMTCLTSILMGKADVLLTYLVVMIPMIISVVGYAVMFFRQVHAKIRIQTSLYELELAHRKVEELTLANERQRMARDLHDTLAQGLAGLIMQLEAINAHLSKGNIKRGQEIVQQAMERVRGALADARSVIDNLRSQSDLNVDFTENIRDEVYRFTSATGISCELDINPMSFLPALITEHGQYIISECLTNIARHAQANHVWMKIEKRINDILYIEIKDDGIGFDSEIIGKQAGHYGLIGMKERIRILKGTININSKMQEGTHIQIEIPMSKGE